jgi:hypothetical protein
METQRLVQQATPDGVLVTTIETAYKRPEAEPGKDPRTDGLKLVVLVSGSILGIERDPNAALLELTDGIRGGRAGTLVTIESQETGVVAGSRSLGFKLAVDLFPEPPLAAAEVN